MYGHVVGIAHNLVDRILFRGSGSADGFDSYLGSRISIELPVLERFGMMRFARCVMK